VNIPFSIVAFLQISVAGLMKEGKRRNEKERRKDDDAQRRKSRIENKELFTTLGKTIYYKTDLLIIHRVNEISFLSCDHEYRHWSFILSVL
jgi:hypothetical protein